MSPQGADQKCTQSHSEGVLSRASCPTVAGSGSGIVDIENQTFHTCAGSNGACGPGPESPSGPGLSLLVCEDKFLSSVPQFPHL
jgi:hypothetical protein